MAEDDVAEATGDVVEDADDADDADDVGDEVGDKVKFQAGAVKSCTGC